MMTNDEREVKWKSSKATAHSTSSTSRSLKRVLTTRTRRGLMCVLTTRRGLLAMKREDGMGGEAATGCDGGAIPSEPRLVLKKLAALRCLCWAGQPLIELGNGHQQILC